jgi:hypothetical protein
MALSIRSFRFDGCFMRLRPAPVFAPEQRLFRAGQFMRPSLRWRKEGNLSTETSEWWLGRFGAISVS